MAHSRPRSTGVQSPARKRLGSSVSQLGRVACTFVDAQALRSFAVQAA